MLLEFMISITWFHGILASVSYILNTFHYHLLFVVLLFSVPKSCLTLCDPLDCSTSGFRVHHYLLKFAQTHVHSVGDAIQPSHFLLLPSPFAFNLSQHQGLFQRVSSAHQVAKVLELQLPHIFTLNQAGLEEKLIWFYFPDKILLH